MPFLAESAPAKCTIPAKGALIKWDNSRHSLNFFAALCARPDKQNIRIMFAAIRKISLLDNPPHSFCRQSNSLPKTSQSHIWPCGNKMLELAIVLHSSSQQFLQGTEQSASGAATSNMGAFGIFAQNPDDLLKIITANFNHTHSSGRWILTQLAT